MLRYLNRSLILPSGFRQSCFQLILWFFRPLTFTDVLSDPRCLEPMKQGDCWNYVVKWYYDKDANSCGQFWYGGCNGTNNRFETEKECRETCVD
uniref:BPTI/Kunitz inhibitor domain-containing protein n=1 Tax=Taeniopygia guttata TaxID=59729 RepID=A0A674G887_TAEGU